MGNYIKGNAVLNATSYTLHNKANAYEQLARQTTNTSSGILFDLDSLSLAEGTYTFVVKAKADGYQDSDFSNEVVYTIDNEENPDITDLFVWTNGIAINAVSPDAGQEYATNLFKSSDYVDISEIPNFEMSFMKWKSGSGTQATLGYALYNANKEYVSGVRFPLDAAAANSSGTPYTITVNVTDPSVKYIRTCYPVDESKYGVFEATVIDAMEPSENITSLFNWQNNAAINAVGDGAGGTYTTSLFKYSDYVDISEIPDFRMSFVKWRSSAGTQATLGYALYNANKEYVSGVQFELADASVGNSAGEVTTIDVHITNTNIKYIRTCYPVDESKYGVFEAYKLS